MLITNLHLAFRQLSKNRTYTLLNIFGLAVGIAASLLIYRILRFEMSFNQNFRNRDRIVHVITRTTGGESGDVRDRGIPIPAMAAMENAMPQFELTTRIHEDWPTLTIPNPGGGAPLKKMGIGEHEISYFAQPSFLKILDFQWIAGDPATALNNAGDIILTRRAAEYCFEKCENALGKTVVLDNNVPCTVRGVIETMPATCDFPFFTIASYATLQANKDLYGFVEDQWGSISSNDQFFALLRDKSQFSATETALAQIGKSEMNNDDKPATTASLAMQNMADMHFDEEIGNSTVPTISRTRLWVLASIGFLVLLMACFNFINLATALASMRAREVGVRKAIGGARSALIAQFMTETSLIVSIAVAAGLTLAAICKPLLKHISEVPDSQPFLTDPMVWAFLGAIGVLVTVLSGIYPSLVLSGFSPIKALKNNVSQETGGGASLRKGLVIAQFAIAQALIIGAIITVSQLNYVHTMDMGLDKNLVMVARFNGDSASLSKLDGMKQRLEQIASVEKVSFSSDRPTSGSTWNGNFAFGRGNPDAGFNTSMKFCDEDFQKTYGLQMLAGRWLEPSDTLKEFVINETMCRKLGIKQPEAAIGQELRLGSRSWKTVVGVVKDFHSHSAHRDNEPMVLACRKKHYSTLSVKIRPDNITSSVAAVQKVFDEAFPEQVFNSRFFDESLAEFYQEESRFSDFCKGIAALAVLIGCLGLFGLATHAAARRTKEIGVRKVLGASVANITGLLTRDFLKLVLVAIVIATPLAYYLMQRWLSDFVFRVDIQWWMFAIACGGAVAVAFFTVSFQSIKAALANPVKSLRSE